jgi:hypothetical protein
VCTETEFLSLHFRSGYQPKAINLVRSGELTFPAMSGLARERSNVRKPPVAVV